MSENVERILDMIQNGEWGLAFFSLIIMLIVWLISRFFMDNLFKKQMARWAELAQKTGLTYESSHFDVRGKYRGRHLVLYIVKDDTEMKYPNFSGTGVSVCLDNSGKFAFKIQTPTAYNNQCEVVSGQPNKLARRAAEMIAQSAPVRSIASIELIGSYLIAKQGMLTDMQIQIAVFDLLCDLADMVEKMGDDIKKVEQISAKKADAREQPLPADVERLIDRLDNSNFVTQRR